MKKLLCLLLGTLVSTSSMSANWEFINYANGGEVYIDTDSIKKNKNILRFWIKYENIGSIVEAKYLYEINCKTEEHRMAGGYAKFNSQNVIEVDSDNWKPIAPDTNLDQLYSLKCK